ncbi:ER membrane protein complex subunit 8 isoform X2 [Hippopotamus amphibius kiboko]|uniref:ER membrane protein complex subunit 8 isoform X2 n=1 Tax=Hippopotamus amphibius kiboko TaxID=575201 RepID=UPI002597CC86|nr:ER membrane protein complex subunit 8 isoform X2 [Hippopotamus amphibius kiboko]
MPGVKLTTQAYCKMVLHGAKYPHCAVNGLLVAEKQKARREHPPPGGPGAPHTLLVDCVPLFHGALALAPMLEVALTLIDSWCKDNSYVIAGYYQANERVKDASPNQVAEKVASRIAEGFSDTALIMVSPWLLSVLWLTWSFTYERSSFLRMRHPTVAPFCSLLHCSHGGQHEVHDGLCGAHDPRVRAPREQVALQRPAL